jgi:hypothetical protein
MTGSRERSIFWALVGGILLATGAAYGLILGPPPGERAPIVTLVDGPAPAPAPAAPSRGAPLPLVLAAVEGEVTLVRDGLAAPARRGDALLEADAVVTAAGARAELAGGPYALRLEEAGRLELEAAGPGLSRVRLPSGLVSARVNGGALEISGAQGASARSEGGAFSVAREGESLSVAVEEGVAELRAAGGAVEVGSGQRSAARQGGPPAPPGAIPASLVLHVKWPAVRKTNHGRLVVTGATAPGAVLVIAGERVPLEPDGRFTHVVALREGEQKLRAHARAPGGLVATAEGPVVVLDTRPPGARFDTRGLWKKR